MIKCWMPLSRNTLNSGLSVLHTENSGATNSEVGGCKCYVFDGESGIKINEELVSNLSQLSVSFWIYQTGTTTVGNAFSFEVSTYWQFTLHNGLLYVRDNGGTDLSTFSIGNIAKNRWIYLVFTYDHGNISIYKDGELTTTGQTEGTALNNGITNNWIGRCQQGGNFFLDGYIRDFRVYDHVLSDDDIQRINLDLCYELNSDMFIECNARHNKPIIAAAEHVKYAYGYAKNYESRLDEDDYSSNQSRHSLNNNAIINGYHGIYFEGNHMCLYKKKYPFGNNILYIVHCKNTSNNYKIKFTIYKKPDDTLYLNIYVFNGAAKCKDRRNEKQKSQYYIVIEKGLSKKDISLDYKRENNTGIFRIMINACSDKRKTDAEFGISERGVTVSPVENRLPNNPYFFDKSGMLYFKSKINSNKIRLHNDEVLINDNTLKKYDNIKFPRSFINDYFLIVFHLFKNRKFLSQNENISENYLISLYDLEIGFVYSHNTRHYITFANREQDKYFILYFQSSNNIKHVIKNDIILIYNKNEVFLNGLYAQEITLNEYLNIFTTCFNSLLNKIKYGSERLNNNLFLFNGTIKYFKAYKKQLSSNYIDKEYEKFKELYGNQ